MVKSILDRMQSTKRGGAPGRSGGRPSDLLRAVDGKGQTPLHYAAAQGNWGVMAALVKAGADPNSSDPEGSTPFHLLALSGRHELLVKFSRELNGAVDAEDTDGRTALHLAAAAGRAECLQPLVELGLSVNHPLPPTTRLTVGATPLHLAACEGHAECVSQLVALGAQVCSFHPPVDRDR